MKSFFYLLRRINPIFALPIFWISCTICTSVVYGNTHENMIRVFGIVMSSLVLFVVTIMILNRLTKGKSNIDSGYVSQVGVSIFGGSNLRWEGYFKTKSAAVFSAIYRAWYLDHFGDVYSECGIIYNVSSYKEQK